MSEDIPAVRILLTTVATTQDAERIATTLVAEQLAACVNILPGVRSVYRWQGKVESAEECLLLLKTDEQHRPRLETRLKELHPYDLPELLVLAPEGGSAQYLAWIADCLGHRHLDH
ncbi:MAG: divalent-cation tolerance protein CutA [Acidobacteriaceae bacterium]